MNYIEITFDLQPKAPWSEILTAYLSELDFESFVDTERGFSAYIKEDLFDQVLFDELPLISVSPNDVKLSYKKRTIPAQNWNASWESSFDPVIIGGELAIVAPFHTHVQATQLKIIIEPKMSFGTGHHQTTRLMSKALLDFKEIPKRVLDMGCGTGVLAILAEQLGAAQILAVDVEEWAVENAIENTRRNNCQHITVELGNSANISGKSFDLILANINKNVLKADILNYSSCLESNGKLMLSGFFTSDNSELLELAENCNLALLKNYSEDNWSCLLLVKN